MKEIFQEVLKRGTLIKENKFETTKGHFDIRLFELDDSVFFFKYKNSQIVECKQLSDNKERDALRLVVKQHIGNAEDACTCIRFVCIHCGLFTDKRIADVVCKKCKHFKYCPIEYKRKD